MSDKENIRPKKYLLYLINPKQKYVNYYGQTELSKLLGVKKFMIPLSIPMVASLTPDNYDIRIIDEDYQKLPAVRPDIVGISSLASTINRSYALADHYRSIGVKVVLGGPYVSFKTEEALLHADSIIVGEAEGLWEKCLADFENGSMHAIYRTDEYIRFDKIKPPRWELIDKKNFFQVGVQVSRGCPYNCEFCLVTQLFGRKMRYREIDNVIAEIESLPVKKLLFVDDNLTVNKRYARELMARLKPLKISWGCMSSIEIANDTELLKEMAEAGCFNILIGFESLNVESLNETHKDQNKSASVYRDAIQKIHAAGLHITASFVIGFDNDTVDEFDRIYRFTQETGLTYINFNILGAPPGTELYYRLKKEGRIYDIDPEMISGLFPCMHYNKMSQTELFDNYIATLEKMYSYKSLHEKAVVLFGNGSFQKAYNDGSPSFGFKAKLVFWLLKEYIFTTDADKRQLFRYIISLIRGKKVVIDMGLSFLISMISYNRHIAKLRANINHYRQLISKYDLGPWEKLEQKPVPHD
ncbi:MAG: radical SAM protein [Bacteroidota bacterium]